MAIEKIRKMKLEISPAAALQLAVSAGVILLSLVLGYLALVRWRLKVNLLSGYESYAAGDLENARKRMEAALSWKPDHTGARELLAKIQCDINLLNEAEANYQQLIGQGYAPPQVRVGLGVVYLKRADKADPKDAAPLLKRAYECFEGAGGIPESAIGLGHCDLLQAERLGDPSDPRRYEAAIRRFRKIREEMNARKEYRAQCTPWGLVDYYAGLGKALAASPAAEDQQAALEAFRCWVQLAGRAAIPRANRLAMETRNLEGRTYSLQEITSLKPQMMALRRESELWKTYRDAYAELKEPWLQFTLALAKAFLEAGVDAEYENLVRELLTGGGFDNRLDVYRFEAAMRSREVIRGEGAKNLETLVSKASAAYRSLLGQSLIRDESSRPIRALAHNGWGWMEAWLGSYNSNEAKLREAQTQFTEAVKLYPDDYVFNRNLCVVLRRLRRPDREIQPYLEKARAAPKEEGLAEDFARFERYITAP